MTPQTTIRPADPDRDAAACAAIYAPSVTGSPTSFELEAPDAAAFARRIAAYSATHAFLVAEQEGEVVGYAYACPYAEREAYRWSVEASVYIDAGHHGEGLGRALYTELFARLRAQGFQVVTAGITLPNPASVGLHESMGFEPAGVVRADRLEARRLARRRQVAAAAPGAGLRAPRRAAPARRRGLSARPGYHWAMPDEQQQPTVAAPDPAPAAPEQHSETLTEEDVFEALEEVIDPELGLDFVSLGLVYGVEIEKEDVYVTFTLTTPACPIGPQVSEQMKEFVGDLPGVSAVHPKMVFDPAWSPEMMTEDAKFALGF